MTQGFRTPGTRKRNLLSKLFQEMQKKLKNGIRADLFLMKEYGINFNSKSGSWQNKIPTKKISGVISEVSRM